jgi:hypothetical protein
MLLSTAGILGTYKECKLTHIYLIETNTNKYFHYYALLSYEKYYEQNKKLREVYLTPKLISINKNYKLSIKRSRVPLNNAREIFNLLCANNLYINYLRFMIWAVYAISEKSCIKYNKMLNEVSSDFERVLYS